MPKRTAPVTLDPEDLLAVVRLLDHPAGFQVAMFGDELAAYRLEDGRFYVMEKIDVTRGQEETRERFFKDAAGAAAYFMARRHARKLGYDFEVVKQC